MFRSGRGKIREVDAEIVRPISELPTALIAAMPADDPDPATLEEPVAEPVEVAVAALPASIPMLREQPAPRPSGHRSKHPRTRPAHPHGAPRQQQPQRQEREAPPAETVNVQPEPAAPSQPSELTCDVLFWRGYLKSAFYARVFSDDGEPLAVAESPFFRARGNGIPDETDEAVAAYQALRDRLESGGWQHVVAGETWFADTFARPL